MSQSWNTITVVSISTQLAIVTVNSQKVTVTGTVTGTGTVTCTVTGTVMVIDMVMFILRCIVTV